MNTSKKKRIISYFFDSSKNSLIFGSHRKFNFRDRQKFKYLRISEKRGLNEEHKLIIEILIGIVVLLAFLAGVYLMFKKMGAS
ncbi:MAG: hypothetical protein ABIH72_01235 [archaeon]